MQGDWRNSFWWVIRGWLVVVLMVAAGCQSERHETPTRGSVTLLVAESVSPVIQEERKKFEELYPEAHVILQVTTARDAIARLFNDSITIIVSSRPLNAEEHDVAKRSNLTIREFKIAIDGVALIVNNKNPITRMRTTLLDSILSGTVTDWKVFSHQGWAGPIEICLPDRNSGTYEVVAMRILRNGRMIQPSKVVATSEEMIGFVAENMNAFGIVGVNWLGVGNNKARVKVLELNDPLAPDSLGTRGSYFSPHQAYLYQRFYPLTREIYVFSRADNYGVAAGFTSFMTSAPGQKIIVQNGLAPATMPVRLVELTNRSIRQ